MKNLTTKLFAGALTVALLLSALTGCGASKETASASAGSSPEGASAGSAPQSANLSAKENTIYFSLPAGQVRTAFQILAQELGYYTEEGVKVEFVNASGTDALTAISTNQADIDILGTGIVPAMTFMANGSDLVFFGGTAVEGSSIISAPDKTEYYRDLTNFEGVTAAMCRNQTSWVEGRSKLVEAGVDVSTINIMEVDSQINVVQAVAKGEADVGFLTNETVLSAQGLNFGLVYNIGEIAPNYLCCRQTSSPAKLEEKHDAFVRFTIANLRAWEFFANEDNRKDVVSVVAKQSGQTEEYIDKYLFGINNVLTLDPNEKGIISFYDHLIDSGILSESARSLDIAERIDTSIYEEALKTLLEREPDNAFYQELLTTYRQYNNTSI